MSGASAAAFRIAFGAVALVGTLRYVSRGWVADLLLDPPLHFTYPGLDWVRPWPGGWMYLHFALMGLAALGIVLGWRYRASVAAYAVLFTWVELIDRTLYLNHYYWVSLTAALMTFLPLHHMWSLDARAGRTGGRDTVPAMVVWVLRGQLAMVYLFAGLAKLGTDWVLHAQPLATWLPARQSLPVIGPLLTFPATAHAMSWAGALFDLTIVGWLLWRRSRPWAYAAVIAFHTLTWLLFPSIGLFPLLMIGGTLIFFSPDWPVRLWRRWQPSAWGRQADGEVGSHRDDVQLPRHTAAGVSLATFGGVETGTASHPEAPRHAPAAGDGTGRRVPRAAAVCLAAYLALMAVVPLRHLTGSGEVLWSGEGYQFGWRVMLTEKAGTVQFRVTDPATDATWVEPLPTALTPRQAAVAATDPAMIRQVAHWIAASHEEAVEVRADAFLSLNGRPRARLLDPGVDLTSDSLPDGWVLPPPA